MNYFLLCPARLPVSSVDEHVDLTCHQGEYWFEVLLAEAAATFLFISVCISIKYNNGTGDEAIDGAAIGASYAFASKIIENFTY